VRYEEIEVSDNIWSRFIVLKSSEDGVPLTKIPPFVIEKCIKSCAGEVKNVTKLKSGGLMIGCQRKQQSLNLLSLKQIHNINISSTPSSLLFNTINRDQILSETSISSYLTSFPFFFLDLLESVYLKDLKQPCIIVHHPCPHPPRSANMGDT
jgi:hypothetical protein